MAKQYRSVPTVVEAIQYDGSNADELIQWAGDKVSVIDPADRDDDPECDLQVFDETHNTWILVYKTQWIIKGTKGEFYPCADDVFRQKYEEA